MGKEARRRIKEGRKGEKVKDGIGDRRRMKGSEGRANRR